MQQTQLFSLLKQLSTRERSQFGAFVASPFFNKNQVVQRLTQYLLANKLISSNTALDRSIAFREVYGRESFDELKFNNLVSDVLQLLYKYLAHQRLENQATLQQHLLIEQLQDKDLHTNIPKQSRRFRQVQEKSSHRNCDFFWYEYQYYNGLDAAFLAQSKHADDPNLQLKSDHLDLYYMANKLRIACDMLSRNIVVNAQYECHLLDAILAYYEKHQTHLESIPALSIFYRIYQMLLHADEEQYYQEVKEQLVRDSHLFPVEEAHTMYSFALNYCVRKINSGRTIFYQEILDLYKQLLEQKIIIRNDIITRWTFTNIITAAIRLEEYEWAERFIQNYQTYLSEQTRANVVTYNLATLHYEQKKYHKALQQLHDVEFNDPSYHTGAKIIQMKCYYELDETEAFLALIDAFNMYILRSRKISTYQKRANKNMLILAKKIYKLQLAEERIKREEFQLRFQKLQMKIEQSEPLANKKWLMEILLKSGE